MVTERETAETVGRSESPTNASDRSEDETVEQINNYIKNVKQKYQILLGRYHVLKGAQPGELNKSQIDFRGEVNYIQNLFTGIGSVTELAAQTYRACNRLLEGLDPESKKYVRIDAIKEESVSYLTLLGKLQDMANKEVRKLNRIPF